MATSNPRILFVDDEPEILNGLSRQLRRKRADWDMSFETTPQAALETMRQCPADVVISDMRMPGMTGLELVIAMRELAPRSIYMMLTGTADLTTAVEAINEAEIFRFYTKPCPPELLIEGIEAGLKATANTRSRRPENEIQGGSHPQSESNQATSITEGIGLAALNRLALSVIVVDQNARVLLTNRSGGALLSQSDGLTLSGQEICRASARSETEELHSLIKAASCGEMDDSFDAGTMALTRPTLKRPLSVLVVPLVNGGPGPAETASLAALFITDPENQPLPTAESIAKVFDLTRAESNIVYALARGNRLEEAAKISGVTISTARTYLKQVFSKTDTNRQSELIKLVLAYPAITAESLAPGT